LLVITIRTGIQVTYGNKKKNSMSISTPPSRLVQEMGDFVDPYASAITLIKKGDNRSPPGDHHGSGWLVEINGHPHLCTCEHVAKYQSNATLGYSCFGSEYGISVGSSFSLFPHPVDFALASLENTWGLISHQGKCIPKSLIAALHQPVEREYLYVYGFPGADAFAMYEQHLILGTGVFVHQVPYDPILDNEHPRVDPNKHIYMAWNPESAIPLASTNGNLSAPPGMSGSVLWNTRYREVENAGGTWKPEDARVTGIVWGASSKAGLIVATPIEYFINYL
jgi:hypothetical protein